VKRSNRLVILVGVLLAVLAFVGIVILLNQGTTPGQAETLKTKVLVAKQAIDIGTPVTPDMVEVKEVEPSDVSGTALGDPSQVGGRPALVAVPAGSQVSKETFGVGNTLIDISGQLKSGEKAVTLQLDRTTGVDFLVKPGDIIDVVLAEDVQVLQPTADSTDQNPRFEPVPGLNNARTVKTILQQKRVLYVSQNRAQQSAATPSPGAENAPPQQFTETVIIVFAGTDQDAELVKFAQRDQSEQGALTVTIRATADTANEDTKGLTIDRLVSDFGLPVPGIVEQVGPSTAPASR
jgi:Flp pilus assembly protein CpaB